MLLSGGVDVVSLYIIGCVGRDEGGRFQKEQRGDAPWQHTIKG